MNYTIEELNIIQQALGLRVMFLINNGAYEDEKKLSSYRATADLRSKVLSDLRVSRRLERSENIEEEVL
jgi:hypothetical protein